jgi:hypothetical protein
MAYNSIVVVLEENVAEEQLMPLMAAISQMRGVLSVRGMPAEPLVEFVAASRVRREITEKLLAVVSVYPSSNKL